MEFLQEIFDIGARHLLTQRAHSFKNGYCAYRGDNGLKCGAAPFIHSYDEKYERKTVKNLEEIWKVFSDCGYSKDEIELIAGLQRVHDGYAPREWKTQLKQITELYNLSPKVLEGF